MRSRPGFSVTSMRLSGRKARPHGWSSPPATVSTRISTFSLLRRCGCCPRAGRAPAASAAQARTRQDRVMAGSPGAAYELGSPAGRSTAGVVDLAADAYARFLAILEVDD